MFNAAWEATGQDPDVHDAPLSELGLRQVAETCLRLAQTEVELAVTSPLTRAIQTCTGLFAGRGIRIVVEALHREYRGSSCDFGRSPKLLAQQFPELDFSHLEDPWWHVDPAGGLEPLELFTQRVSGFRNWLAARPERTIAVVGHGTFFYHLAGRPFENCEVFDLRL